MYSITYDNDYLTHYLEYLHDLCVVWTLEDEGEAGHFCLRLVLRRGCAHAGQTFSTSGRPSSPVGMKINTTIRIENAATSLYSTEK